VKNSPWLYVLWSLVGYILHDGIEQREAWMKSWPRSTAVTCLRALLIALLISISLFLFKTSLILSTKQNLFIFVSSKPEPENGKGATRMETRPVSRHCAARPHGVPLAVVERLRHGSLQGPLFVSTASTLFQQNQQQQQPYTLF